MPESNILFDQFPPVTPGVWKDKIIEDLKGADFNKRMIWRTAEGIDILPFYCFEDIERLRHLSLPHDEFPYLRGGRTEGNRWLVRQDIEVGDILKANKKALDILMKGVDSLGFIIRDPGKTDDRGLSLLLSGIKPDAVEINFLSDGKASEILSSFRNIISDSGSDPSLIRGAIEADPLGRLLMNGKLCVSLDKAFDYLSLLTASASDLPLFRTVRVNASFFVNAGADIVTELAYGLAMGNEYMAILTGHDLSPDLAASKIKFTFGIGPAYFLEIAKLRAARLLWSVITDKYSLSDRKNCRMEIHSVTGEWNKTLYDPYVNMLRTQTEAMSATLGCTDSLTVEPYDKVFSEPDDFSERIARNQQLLLKEEAYFDKVADPAGGSYYIENLTSAIARKAWKLFLEVEEEGGFVASLKNRSVQSRIRESSSLRSAGIASGKTILVGTNRYPDFEEVKTSVPVSRQPLAGDDDMIVEPVMPARGAGEIEKLRHAAGIAARRPVVFLLTIGDPVMRRARAQFAGNFFACGGYQVIDNNGFDTPAEGAMAALKAGSDIVVVCSSDKEYEESVPIVFDLCSGGPAVAVAGNPECEATLRSAGVEHFISLRSDIVKTIRSFHVLTGLIN